MSQEKKEECGLFGVFGDPDAVELTFFGLHSLQHRGQESAGIASSDGKLIQCYKNMGEVRRVFRPGSDILSKLKAPMAIGHVRYSTTGSNRMANCQPLLCDYLNGQVAVAHNGNIVNAAALKKQCQQHGHIFNTTSDTEILIQLLARPSHFSKADPLPHVLKHLKGSYCFLLLYPDRIEAVRDPSGNRPLSIGRTKTGCYVVASETCAFDAVDAEFVREVEPGEIVTINKDGLSSRFFVEPGSKKLAHCIFELVYFAKQSSLIFGENVHLFRKRLGEQLAKEYPVDADVVIPIPDSGTSAAVGYAKQSGIPFDMGLIRSHYVGRTFISPGQRLRELEVKLKLSIVKEAIVGKRVVVVDDSIVRGTTMKEKIRALRQAGAKEVHLRISCPPVKHPCFYGVDFPTKQELIANRMSISEIEKFLDADSLGYISLEGMVNCASFGADNYCTACWSGQYKIPIEEACKKNSLERIQSQMNEDWPGQYG